VLSCLKKSLAPQLLFWLKLATSSKSESLALGPSRSYLFVRSAWLNPDLDSVPSDDAGVFTRIAASLNELLGRRQVVEPVHDKLHWTIVSGWSSPSPESARSSAPGITTRGNKDGDGFIEIYLAAPILSSGY
jgi:hypothetical protein